MVMTTAIVKKWGNSLGVIIGRPVSKKLNLRPGQRISMDLKPVARKSYFGILKGFDHPFERDKDREFD
jgi:antitoxin component of MazEF toxin-antitoxin module